MKTNIDPITRWFHWCMASIILYATMAGYYMHVVVNSHPKIFNFLSTLNMSLATVAAPVFVARWVWSYFRPSEGNVKNKTTYSAVVSLAHAILYFLMFMVFISGFFMLTDGYYLFGLIYMPNLITSVDINGLFFTIHRFSCLALFSLVLVHISAALYHHFVMKDKILLRMLGKDLQ